MHGRTTLRNARPVKLRRGLVTLGRTRLSETARDGARFCLSTQDSTRRGVTWRGSVCLCVTARDMARARHDEVLPGTTSLGVTRQCGITQDKENFYDKLTSTAAGQHLAGRDSIWLDSTQ